ncbi:hypothetical protein BCV70DRAFT_77784 [Testicularia cyperi]|uniref:Uncharacterized protein n=1 Tax=Testicularia cyperi TaxID=1882483 RepID=A0A317XUZ2_9BASI|nr:hypothetical protein BCV70DRAFT_77784 [Testicularia cyperi]
MGTDQLRQGCGQRPDTEGEGGNMRGREGERERERVGLSGGDVGCGGWYSGDKTADKASAGNVWQGREWWKGAPVGAEEGKEEKESGYRAEERNDTEVDAVEHAGVGTRK